MNKIKRIVLSLSIALTIIVALIVSMVFKFNDSDSDIPAKAVNSDIKYTNTFEEGEVVIQTGGSNLNYSYTPDINSNAGVSVAYEYIFHNPMNVEQAVNL